MHDETIRNGHHFGEEDEDQNDALLQEGTLLTDELDHDILMHRDAHFGGDFKIMLDYYLGDHIGVNPDFEMERIEYLAQVESELEQNLAPMMLSGPEAERVAKARRAYEKFKALYEVDDEKARVPRLIADLILSEDEEPEAEIEALIREGQPAINELLAIIHSEDAYDPLFPGYGYAPYLAILTLGRMQATEAIIPIFEVLGTEAIFEEDVILEAFHEIGQPAKEFLMKVVKSRPLSQDNMNAAFMLTAFPDDEEVAIAAYHQLKDLEVLKNPLLVTYLLASIDALARTEYREEFLEQRHNRSLPEAYRDDLDEIAEDWGETLS